MIDGRNFLDQPVRWTYDIIRKIAAGQDDD